MVRHRAKVVVSLAVGIVLSGCGSNRQEIQRAVGESGSEKIVKVGVIVPLSGATSPVGVGVRNAVDLAVRQANAQRRIEGWRIVLDPQDDQATPSVGANAAAKLADGNSVMAVVGTLISSVAEAVAPIFNSRNVLMVSPSNTNPTLTQGADPSRKVRSFPNYFRVVTTDAIQGPFAADYVYDTLGKRKVVVVHDKKTYGQGLALAFKARFERRGGQVPAVETVEPEDKDFAAVLSKIRRYDPDLIYYGGEYPTASLLTSQADQQGLRVPFMGGDGIFSRTYIDVAGRAADGDFTTSQSTPAEQLPTAREFVDAYQAAGYPDPYEVYGIYGYDAANVIIEALSKVLPGQDKIDDTVRARFRQAVQDTNLDGVTGTISFDQYGDTTVRVLTVYQVNGGAWKPQKTAEFGSL